LQNIKILAPAANQTTNPQSAKALNILKYFSSCSRALSLGEGIMGGNKSLQIKSNE
jgi:hypothetical protein